MRVYYSLLLFLGLSFNICGAYAEEGQVTFLIDDFEAKRWVNLIGGPCSSWEADPYKASEYCRASFNEDERGSRKTTALRLQYNLNKTDYNGYYTKLNGFDLRPYKYLTLWIKRSEKFYPNVFKIEIKSNTKTAFYRYTFTDSDVEWTRLEIPLEKFYNFGKIDNWKQANELTIVFEGRQTKPASGVLYIDDIGFSSPVSFYNRQAALIEKEAGKKNKEMRKLASLPEDELLDLISQKTFDYFWLEASPVTGLIKDRNTLYSAASMGATGFGLTALCIGAERKWITPQEAYNRVVKTLKSLRDIAAKEHGFFYHWVNSHTGKRDGRSEVSSVDTALLLGGVLTVREYFPQPEIKELADEVYRNIQWSWMMGDDVDSGLLYMGWSPEDGFKKFIRWDMFAEEMMMYLLGMGSPTYPLPAQSWHSFVRPVKQYDKEAYLYHDGESMFVYTYSHAWVDFRDKHDAYADYWLNSAEAIKANYRVCMDNKNKLKTYKEGYWGISACDGPQGYAAYGALYGMNDGTIPPYSLCAAVPFVPELAIPSIRSLLANYGYRVWGKYGFVSAFNLDKDWFSTEYIGIDEGIILLMIENYRSGFVWKTFMANPYIKAGMDKAEFQAGTKKLDIALLQKLQEEREKALDKETRKMLGYHAKEDIKLDGDLQEWENLTQFSLDKDIEFGEISGPDDLSASFGFQWDEEYLYFAIDVTDNEIAARESKGDIYRGDGVEVYLDFKTKGRNLVWGDKENFQIGLVPDSITGQPAKWAWFQDMDPKDNVKLAVNKSEKGYTMEAAIKWSFLSQKPQPGLAFGASVAVHDVDSNTRADKKLNWWFKKSAGNIRLGEMSLVE